MKHTELSERAGSFYLSIININEDMTHLEHAQKLYQMIGEGQMVEAIDELYADNVTIIEANGDTFEGKETQKGRLGEWQAGIEEFHGGGVTGITANEEAGVTMVESWTEITPKGGQRFKFEEIAVQQWENGKIARERFYYFVPAEMQQQMAQQQQAQTEA